MVAGGADTGYAIAAIYLVGSAYATLAVVGGGLYLAYRRAVRREVNRLLGSVTTPSTAGPVGRGRSELQRGEGRP